MTKGVGMPAGALQNVRVSDGSASIEAVESCCGESFHPSRFSSCGMWCPRSCVAAA